MKVSSGLTKQEASPSYIVEGMPMAAVTRGGLEYAHLAQGNKFVIRCRQQHAELFSWTMPPEVAQETQYSVVGSGEYRMYLTAKEDIKDGHIEHVVYGFDHLGNETWWTYDESLAYPTNNKSAHQNFIDHTQPIAITADHEDRPWVLVFHGNSFNGMNGGENFGPNNQGVWLYTGTHYSGELWPVMQLPYSHIIKGSLSGPDLTRLSMTFDSVTEELVLAVIAPMWPGLFELRHRLQGPHIPSNTSELASVSVDVHQVPPAFSGLLSYGTWGGLSAAVFRQKWGCGVWLSAYRPGVQAPVATFALGEVDLVGGFGVFPITSPSLEYEAFVFSSSQSSNNLVRGYRLVP